MFLQASKERQRELLEEKQNIDYGNRSPSSRGTYYVLLIYIIMI